MTKPIKPLGMPNWEKQIRDRAKKGAEMRKRIKSYQRMKDLAQEPSESGNTSSGTLNGLTIPES